MLNLLDLFRQRPEDDNQLMTNDYQIPRITPQNMGGGMNPMLGQSANDMGRISDVMGGSPAGGMRQDPQGFNPSDIYMKHLASLYDTMPDKNNYQPSPMRSFGSKLAALGAMGPATYHDGMALGLDYNPEVQAKIKDAFEYGPYNDAMQKFGIQAKGYTDLAKFEESGNQNKRIEYDQAEANRVRQQNADTAAKRAEDLNTAATARQEGINTQNEATNKQKAADSAIRQQRANTYDYKAKNPNKILKEDDKGFIIGIDPQTGEYDYVMDDQGNPVKSSNLTDVDKQNLKIKGEKELIGARSAAAQSLEGTKNTDRLGQIAATGANAVTTKQTPSGNKSTGSTPTSEKQARINRATDFAARNPTLAKYIHVVPNEGAKIDPPSTGGWASSGPSKTDYDQMYKMIFGTTVDMSGGKPPTNETRIPVVDKAGKPYTIPASQLDSFLKDHPDYKRAK